MPEPEFIHQRASICEMEPKTNNLHSILLLQIYQFNPVFYKQCPELQEKEISRKPNRHRHPSNENRREREENS